MNNTSAFLEEIGMSNFDLGYLVIGMAVVILILIILLIVLIVQTRKVNQLKKKMEKFMTGKNAKSLEKEITSLFEDNLDLKKSTEENRKNIKTLFKN